MDKQNSKFRWIVFATVLFTYFIIVSQRTAPGLISDQLMKDFNVTASTIGLLASIQFFAYAGLQVPIGILSDRFGPNLFLIVGTLLTGVGTLLYSLAPNESILFLARLIVGTGDATIWVNVVLILSQWFKGNEFIKLLGMAGMTGSLGFLMATVPFSIWIALSGWRASFFTMGIILCLCGILLYFVLVKYPKRMVKNNAITSSSSVKSEHKREKTLVILNRIFSNQQAWAAFLCHFGAVGTYVGFIGSWAVPYGMDIFDMTRSGASQFIMIGLIGALIGAPLTSWISSRMQSIKIPYITVHLLIFLSWSAFLLFSGKPPLIILMVLFLLIGYGNGASALTFAIVRQSFDVKEVGVASGFANMGGFLSAVLLPSFFGKVLDHFQLAESNVGYLYGFMIPVIFSMIGLFGGFLIKEQHQEITQTKELSV
ncbi:MULTISPECIES: MFS transporter [Metabacillus]|uniref:Lysosomal dipeptide transporter MFSD1 n=2 Tax=Metabacillus TaxID=2675233 RepID=A0A179SM81_9BACI|nr:MULTISPECIES: MFS transporter [Metabacillus]OAS82776.1 MFS transporter [Metabacillus litoralis]QNF30217.1 MFS transporter [Metabacillus sp. KUDC1714]